MTVFDKLIRLTRRLHLAAGERIQPVRWRPPMDVYRTKEGWLIKIEVAGVRTEEVEVTLEGRLLIVRGRRCDLASQEGVRFYSLEIAYSHFERIMELPEKFSQPQLATEYRDGMLFVRIFEGELGS
jgi:HSP20 family protein